MASKALSSTAMLLSLNLLFMSMVSSASATSCPTDLSVCANVLKLVNVVVGSPETEPCCSLFTNLTDLEAAVCLCAALKADVLGTNLNIELSLSVILNSCGRQIPADYTCA